MKQNKLYLLKQLLFWFMKNIFITISNRQASPHGLADVELFLYPLSSNLGEGGIFISLYVVLRPS